jgi:CRISPR system Cascade subunit CasE
MKGFPQVDDSNARETAKVLYRVMMNDSIITIYIQSEGKPDLSKYEVLTPTVCKTQDISSLKEKLITGSTWKINLLAVPSKKVLREGKNSNRIFLTKADDRNEWLKRQGEKGGWKIDSIYEKSEQTCCGWKTTDKFRFNTIEFSGIIVIENQEKFWRTFQTGVGPEKAYGCGMFIITNIQ